MRNDGSFLFFFFEKFLFSSFQNGMNARQIKKKKKRWGTGVACSRISPVSR